MPPPPARQPRGRGAPDPLQPRGARATLGLRPGRGAMPGVRRDPPEAPPGRGRAVDVLLPRLPVPLAGNLAFGAAHDRVSGCLVVLLLSYRRLRFAVKPP